MSAASPPPGPDSEPGLQIFVDADACPVKAEVLRVAERHGALVHIVSNSWMRIDQHPLVRRVVVEAGPDAADDWIAERIQSGHVCVTQDIPLAARCLKKGAAAVDPTGKPFTDASIGMALAMRELNQHLRETGESKGYNAGFGPRDRSRFLETLESLIQSIKRGKR